VNPATRDEGGRDENDCRPVDRRYEGSVSPSYPPIVSLAEIRNLANDHASRAGMRDIAIFSTPRGNGSPYIEAGDAYHYVVEERGVELERRQTGNLDELLYWILADATFSAACSFELENRKPNEDSRRQLFARQEALLEQISPGWAQRKAAEHRVVLTQHPFDDSLG
jgi:hypothetical protein